MSLSRAAIRAFEEGGDYFEEIDRTDDGIGYPVLSLEDVPDELIKVKAKVRLVTYTRKYTGVESIGGHETFYDYIGNKYVDGYRVMNEKEYQEYCKGFQEVKYGKDKYAELCQRLKSKEQANVQIMN